MKISKIFFSVGLAGIGFFTGYQLYQKYNFNINQSPSWKDIKIKQINPKDLKNIPPSQIIDLSQVGSLIEQKKYDEAIQLCNQILAILNVYNSPSDQELIFKSHFHIGLSNFLSGKHQEAIKAFQESLKYNPKDVYTQANLCNCYFLTKEYDNVLKYADFVLNSKQNDLIPNVIVIKIDSLIKLNRDIEAIQFLGDLFFKYPNQNEFLLKVKQKYFQQNK
ncbi:hypothetical protein ABPG74_009186 [Tetrahymena malaccensis]